MNATEQVYKQTEYAIRKIAQKFTSDENPSLITDIHIRIYQDSGELRAFDDDENEITRCVVEEWIGNTEEKFYEHAAAILRKTLKQLHETVDQMNILKPFSFVLENDDLENIAELYVADDDTVIIGGDLMNDLDKDLDSCLADLLKDEDDQKEKDELQK